MLPSSIYCVRAILKKNKSANFFSSEFVTRSNRHGYPECVREKIPHYSFRCHLRNVKQSSKIYVVKDLGPSTIFIALICW